jgi:hypothetical protein
MYGGRGETDRKFLEGKEGNISLGFKRSTRIRQQRDLISNDAATEGG